MQHILPIPNKHLIGHRGVAGLRPENTLCGFRLAQELGLNWVEFDIQLSKDNVWVVIHDETLDRTTSGTGFVSSFSAKDITSLDAGIWFKPPYPDEKVPTLLETLTLLQNLGLYCNIELKVPANEHLRYVEEFCIFAKENKPLLTTCLLSSFDINCAKALATKLKHLPVAYLTEHFTNETLNIIKGYNFYSINCDAEYFTRQTLAILQKQNIPVLLYTVNDPVTAEYWLNLGVTALFTDSPDLLLK